MYKEKDGENALGESKAKDVGTRSKNEKTGTVKWMHCKCTNVILLYCTNVIDMCVDEMLQSIYLDLASIPRAYHG